MEIPIVKSKGLTGDLKPYVNNPLGFLLQKHQEYGDVFKFRLAYRYLHVTSNPDHIQHILHSNHRNYVKSLAYRKLRSLLGNGLFTSEGETWLKNRRLAQPYFRNKLIDNYFEQFKQYSNEMIHRLQGQKEMDLMHEMTTLTLQIIAKSLLDLNLKTEGNVIERCLPFTLEFMVKRVVSSINTPLWWPNQNNKRFKNSVKEINQLIVDLLKQKKQSAEGNDLLSQLILAKDNQSGYQLSDEQLRDEVLTFFLAGHETSAISLCWAIYYIETNPEVKNKLKNELMAKDLDELGAVNECSYLEAIIKETMRIVSPIWVLGRESVNSDNLGEYHLGAGESIIFSPYIVHHKDCFWKNPNEFDPTRFLKENDNHPFAYFPFGGGPRLCIGQHFAMLEMKVILGRMYQCLNFDLKSNNHPGHNFSLTLRPKSPINLVMH